MKIEHAHICWSVGSSSLLTSSATLTVQGLGSVEIKDFISDETRRRIAKEAEFAMNQRLDAMCDYQDNHKAENENAANEGIKNA